VSFPDPIRDAEDARVAKDVSLALLSTGCIEVHTDEPFRLPSGWASPVYIECRRLISFPEIRRKLVQYALNLLRKRQSLEGVSAIAGAEASGIALAAWIAEALDLPMQYVRKQRKGLGPGRQVVGVVHPGESVLLVDDLMSGGRSIVNCCLAIAEAELVARDAFVIFDYETFPTRNVLDTMGVTVHSLATWQDILVTARESAQFQTRELAELETFLADPVQWSHAHGGKSSIKTETKGLL
jgi:orotate phosphoribosyltransferase